MTREEQFIKKLIDKTNQLELKWSHHRHLKYTTQVKGAEIQINYNDASMLYLILPDSNHAHKINVNHSWIESLVKSIEITLQAPKELEIWMDNFLKTKNQFA